MRWVIPCCLLALFSASCADTSKAPPSTADRESVHASAEAKPVASQEPSAEDNAKTSQPPGAEALQRKIIYTAMVNLMVEHFDAVPEQINALVNRFGAYAARSEITGSAGSPRHGHWTVRVPADRYEKFLAAAMQLGEVQNVNSDSREVTEEYYDLAARIHNKKEEEARMLELLAKAAGRLDEVLTLEHELSRVRGETEQMEGRLRVLGDLSTMSSVNVDIREIKGFVPEPPVTYATRVRIAWEVSSTALVSVAQSLSILLVALSPWAGVLLPPLLVVFLVLRMRWARTGPLSKPSA